MPSFRDAALMIEEINADAEKFKVHYTCHDVDLDDPETDCVDFMTALDHKFWAGLPIDDE